MALSMLYEDRTGRNALEGNAWRRSKPLTDERSSVMGAKSSTRDWWPASPESLAGWVRTLKWDRPEAMRISSSSASTATAPGSQGPDDIGDQPASPGESGPGGSCFGVTPNLWHYFGLLGGNVKGQR